MNQREYKYPKFSLPDPEKNFLASENHLYNYSNLYGFCSEFKEKIRTQNINRKRPLALLSKNSNELTFVIAACYLLKIPFITMSPELTDSELRSKIRQLKPRGFFTDGENRARVQGYDIVNIETGDLDKTEPGHSLTSPSSDPEKCFGYFFTSGSSGFPKIVPLLRRQIMFAANASAINFKPDPDRYWLLCLPLNHVGGVLIILRSILYHSAIYRMDRFDERQIRNFLSENRLFQVASLVPTMLQRLLKDPLFQLHNNFKAVLLGGGPIPDGLIDKALERGIPIVSSYGMTETCAQIAANPMLQPRGVYYPKKSVGSLFKPNQIQIRDAEMGTPLPYREIGEIWLKGPQVIDEYLDPKLNAGAFDEDGWFYTGDIGYLNRRKHLFILNRRTDRIITGGENVDPKEVELLLDQMEGIKKSAVLGMDDPEWGQKIVALIVSDTSNEFDPESVNRALKKKLSAYKIPKEYRVVDQIPTTSLGKIKRSQLYDLFQPKAD